MRDLCVIPLGAFFPIEADNRDQAIDIGAHIRALRPGCVEIRAARQYPDPFPPQERRT
jgi:hypothetical protein